MHANDRQPDIMLATGGNASTFTFRWFASLIVLGGLSGRSPRRLSSALWLVAGSVPKNSSIDLFTGFSPNLLVVFAEIALLVANCANGGTACKDDAPATRFLPNKQSVRPCSQLIHDIHTALPNADKAMPVLDVGEQLGATSRKLASDFVSLNNAYHHAALLHLYRRIMKLPSSSVAVQDAVHEILDQVANLELLHEPCPAIAQLFPLFTAGCEVNTSADQKRVTELMQSMQQFYNLLNVKQAISFLRQFWSYRERHDTDVDIHWDEFLGR